MSNDNEKYFEQINVYKDDMLDSCNKLVVNCEDCRQAYEKTIHQHTSETIRKCSQVVAYVTGESVINWKIVSLDGNVIYTSDNKIQNETWYLDISTLRLAPGTQFRLQAYMAIQGYNSDDILEYTPSSNTVYYCFNELAYLRTVKYRGTINSPASPPILQCATLYVYNFALALVKYEIRLVSTGRTIYRSDRYRHNDEWTKDLSELKFAPGTQLRLHAGILGGSDSEPYAIIEYTPNDVTGKFTLDGNAFRTVVMYM